MSSARYQSSSSSFSSRLGQCSSMISIPTLHMLNHSLPIKLDRSNFVLWKLQMDNVVFANGVKGFIEGISICPDKETSTGVISLAFVSWRWQDRMILNQIYSSLTPKIMAQIIGHTTSHWAWLALEKIFSSSSRARIMQLQLELQTTKKGSISMMDSLMKLKSFADSLVAIGENVSERD